ncbi:MAG: hypothetical protein Q4B23_05310 [Helcococcus sp.]|nr:hypothetical protein [Helcococcus sp.]
MYNENKNTFFNPNRVFKTIKSYKEKLSKYSPCIVYNTEYILEIVNYIKEIIPKQMSFKLLYAMKANSNYDILKKLYDIIDGVDVASEYELHKAKNVFPNEKISINGPYFSIEQVNNFIESGIKVDINSIDYFKGLNKNKNIGIRVSDFNDFGIRSSRFGINVFEENIEKYLADFSINRIHLHFGIKDYKFIIKLEKILNRLKNLNMLDEINEINIGGGFHNLFIEGKLEIFFDNLYKMLCKFNIQNTITVVIEPGYLIVNYSGFLFSTVTSSYIENSIQNVSIDSSIYKNTLWFKPKILTILTNMSKNDNLFTTNIFGNTCFEDDKYDYDLNYKKIDRGDKIIFYPVGAYVKSNHSNLHGDKFMKEIYI